jgi:hypothetical protein
MHMKITNKTSGFHIFFYDYRRRHFSLKMKIENKIFNKINNIKNGLELEVKKTIHFFFPIFCWMRLILSFIVSYFSLIERMMLLRGRFKKGESVL